ncbi:MAG: hypothetical protein DWQ19_11030 [Crenarchaeota archaeon]|nr:MAG: hypothetical protein DWQ19_11030 [Thermoproteota archaeon]
MKEVYIVLDNSKIKAVFSTQNKAEVYVSNLSLLEDLDSLVVEKWEVDSANKQLTSWIMSASKK